MLNVYLDSNDYSLLSDPSRASPELQETLADLERLRDSGRVVFRFSVASVTEAAPTVRDAIAPAKRRLQMIRRLCGVHCLVDLNTLLEREREALTQRRSLNASDLRRDDGTWTPPVEGILGDIPSPQEMLKQAICEMGLGRAARRKAEHLAKQRNPEATRRTLDYLRRQYPFAPAAERTLRAYVEGRASKEQMLDCLIEAFVDLDRLANWYDMQWERTTKISGWLRSSGASFVSNMGKLGNAIEQQYKNAAELGIPEADAKRLVDRITKDLVSRGHRIFVEEVLRRGSGQPPTEVTDSDLWGFAPGMSTAGAAMAEIAKSSAFSAKTPRATKVSDFGDVVHSCYVPYVDVFRADGHTARILSQAPSARSTLIVSKLKDLVPALNVRLGNVAIAPEPPVER